MRETSKPTSGPLVVYRGIIPPVTPGDCLYPWAREDLYEKARRHGLGHEAALEAVREGPFWRCWCGKENPCQGGAQRHVGCGVVSGL